jgi:hypothetical protein
MCQFTRDLETRKEPHMPTRLARNAHLAGVLLIAALAGTGCSDQTAPAGAKDGAAASSPVETRQRSRTPRVDYLHVHDNTLYVNSGQAYLTADVNLTNWGPKTGGLSLQGLVQQGLNTVTMSSTPIICSDTEGTLPHGACALTVDLSSPDGGLVSGTALFTLRLLKDGVQLSAQVVSVNVFRF